MSSSRKRKSSSRPHPVDPLQRRLRAAFFVSGCGALRNGNATQGPDGPFGCRAGCSVRSRTGLEKGGRPATDSGTRRPLSVSAGRPTPRNPGDAADLSIMGYLGWTRPQGFRGFAITSLCCEICATSDKNQQFLKHAGILRDVNVNIRRSVRETVSFWVESRLRRRPRLRRRDRRRDFGRRSWPRKGLDRRA
jgi:hypothetical protein